MLVVRAFYNTLFYLLANDPLSDTTDPVHMHRSTAVFIRGSNIFPSVFAADETVKGSERGTSYSDNNKGVRTGCVDFTVPS